MGKNRDRELGMHRRISRRDFLNGVAITIGASLLPRSLSALGAASEYYPPALTGIRGNHDGSFEVSHALRDGSFWSKAGTPESTNEEYDLVIVGAGISGLSSAHFFRKLAGPNARILLIDNHDDFGGHAKRNEFRVGDRTILGFGGTFAIESPAPYSAVAKGLVRELGVDVGRWKKVFDPQIYASHGLKAGVFFDKETFGVDRLVPSLTNEFQADEPKAKPDEWKAFLSQAPIAEQAKMDLQRFCTEEIDYMKGLSSAEKKAKLARISYADFITKVAEVHPDVVKLLQAKPHPLYGVGIDAVPAQDAWGLKMPGFQGMGLDPSFGKGMNRDSMEYPDGGDAFFFHFPDGNASIARMLVRKLIPAAIPGSSMDDVVTARANYEKLDDAASACRIRLNSTVVRVQHTSSKQVEITYARGGKVQSVRANQCILACWSVVIPYICDELPAAQKQDLAFEVKVPLLYTNVLISNWNSFVKAGIRSAYCPGANYSYVGLDMPVSIGDYHCTKNPQDAIVLHLMRTPCNPGLPARTQHRMGRMELMTATFADYERNIRDQLGRILGSSGFDPARDILAITVNRWAHGYAYQYNSLFDEFWLNGEQTPCERARKPFGRIAIANADTGAYAYTDGAIDQAYRAVNEISAALR